MTDVARSPRLPIFPDSGPRQPPPRGERARSAGREDTGRTKPPRTEPPAPKRPKRSWFRRNDDYVGMRRRPAWRRVLRMSLRIGIILVIGLPLFAVAATATGVRVLLFGDLPGTVPKEKPPLIAIPSKVFDSNGNQIGEFRQYDLSVPITKDDIPQVLKDALIAAEDRSFWVHKGVDLEGLSRAAVANVNASDTVQGGSTITQQYVRAKYLNNDRTVERKLNEVLLATRVERELTEKLGSEEAAKEEILFEYLNTTYFGGGAYGVGAAAQTYFHKHVKDLDASEAAMIVSIIPAPSKHDPRINEPLADRLRVNTLRAMRDLTLEKENPGSTRTASDDPTSQAPGPNYKGITQQEYEDAVGQHLFSAMFGFPDRPYTPYFPPPTPTAGTYPYFLDYVRQYMLEKYGPDKLYRGGMTIQTTIDPHLQDLAQQNVNNALSGTGPPLEMSLVSVEPSTGYVKALIGGRDFNASQVNLALGGIQGMQPGSSFKAFTLAKAMEEGYGPDNTDIVAGGTYTVSGCTGACTVRGAGASDMRSATAQSSNTYFAQLINLIGPNKVAELAHRVGVTRISPNENYGISLTLGAYNVSPLDMAAGYATFANHGVKADVTPIVRAVLADGTMVEDNSGPRGVRVLNAAVADWVTDLLTSVVQPGATGYRANIGRPAAGKTGSAEHNTAAWFVGYTPQLTTAIWMGYTDKLRTINAHGFNPVYGGTIPALTWHDYMSAAMAGQPEIPFPTPGILPAPTSGIRKAERESFPNLVQDCGGPCMNLPQLTTPPTTEPPPPEDTVPVESTVPETTPDTTEPPTTGPPGTGGGGFTSSSTSSTTRSRGR